MASADFQTFLEDRLKVLEPTIDLSPGSPAQVQFVQPVMSRLGTDPFETDIDKFIVDRFQQEFPDIYTGDPGAVRDTFIKPLILMLEPFKRETQLIKQNQSLLDPSLLSDADADALVANVFDYRTSGKFSTGVVRVFYANPTSVPVEITTKFSTAGGFDFFPLNPTQITAEAMVFNRQGSLYFMDVPVKSGAEGTDFNIGPDSVSSVEGLTGFVRVTNPRGFSGGTAKIDTPTFVAQAREALNERSLNSRRGASARIRESFQGEVRAIQVIGADDPEMQRDILVAESKGHAWMQGTVQLYRNIALVLADVVEGEVETPPQPGDTLFVYLDKYSNMEAWSDLSQSKRTMRFRVEEVITGGLGALAPYQTSYLVRWSGNLPEGVVLPASIRLSGGFSRKGTIKISSLASVGQVTPFEVPNQEVHVLGHTDIYVRPVLQDVSKAVITNLSDETPLLQGSTLRTFGQVVDLPLGPQDIYIHTSQNLVRDPGDPIHGVSSVNFTSTGVLAGDLLTIEQRDDTGTYVITRVTDEDLFLSTNLIISAENLRYRITRSITINPFDPKIIKLPFGAIPAQDLQTNIGSRLFLFTTDFLAYGAEIGDTVRVKTGLDKGDFAITGFDSQLGGTGVYVDRAATASISGAYYEVFTPLEKLELPLVRIRSIAVLDSSQKTTGIYIPPGEPVAVVPQSDFTTAQVRARSQYGSGYVIPALGEYLAGSNSSAFTGLGNDRRYSEEIEPTEDGMYKAMAFTNGNSAELLFPGDCFDSSNYFLCTSEEMNKEENFPPIDPRPGDALTLKNGPNKGSYLIEKVRKFKYQFEVEVPSGDGYDYITKYAWLYMVKIYGTFPVDVFRELNTFLMDFGIQVSSIQGGDVGGYEQPISFPGFFTDYYENLPSWVNSAIAAAGGVSPGVDIITTALNSLMQVEYEWGDPARGVLRSYFVLPTLFEQNTALNEVPTLYRYKTESGETFDYRPDPRRYEKHEIIPPRLYGDTDPKEYPRDLSFVRETGEGGSYDSSIVTLTDSARPPVSALGLVPGDTLSINTEVLLLDDPYYLAAVQTIAGSPTVYCPALGEIFPLDIEANLFSIEEGKDAGMYVVVHRVDGNTIVLDRALTQSTPGVVAKGSCSFAYGATNTITQTAGNFFIPSFIGKWLTLYGVHEDFAGSYQITEVLNTGCVNVAIQNDQQFPTTPGYGFFVVTDAPTTTPVQKTDVPGTNLHGLRRVRTYTDLVSEFPITHISTSTVTSMFRVEGVIASGIKQPYRIYRKNLRRVNPTEMSEQQDGFLYYFDTEVTSLSPSSAANITRNSYLMPLSGTYQCFGYRHQVADPTLTYSMLEAGKLNLPTKILPVNSADSLDSLLGLVGTPVQVAYERADAVQQLQEFLDSPEDRITSANMLARHFLPAYVSFDAEYVGGSAPGVVVADIINYIDNLPVEMPVDVSVLDSFIEQRGGNPITPGEVSVTIHDWDRKMWVEFNENEVGGLKTRVPYNGSPRVSYAIPGEDVSGQDIPDPGERIKLVQS